MNLQIIEFFLNLHFTQHPNFLGFEVVISTLHYKPYSTINTQMHASLHSL